MEKAVALVSGGLKSAVMVALERSRHDLLLVHVQTGMRASAREQVAFANVCRSLGMPRQLVVPLPHVARLSVHPLAEAGSAGDAPPGPSWGDGYVPGLMAAMLDVAFLCATRSGAGRILVGTCELPNPQLPLDRSPPDQRREYLQIYNDLAAAALPGAGAPHVHAPLMDLSLEEIVKLGRRIGAPLADAWSCMLGGDAACGECPGCRQRAAAFAEAGLPDPALEAARAT